MTSFYECPSSRGALPPGCRLPPEYLRQSEGAGSVGMVREEGA